MRKILKGILVFLLKIQKIVMIVNSLALASMITVAVFLRYVFKTDLYGMEEIEIVVAFWLYFMGASYGSYTHSQIKADIIEVLMQESRFKQFMRCVRSTISSLLFLGLTYLAWDMFAFGLTSGIKTAIWKIPTTVLNSGVFFGIILMSLYSIIETKESICNLIKYSDSLASKNLKCAENMAKRT